MRVNSGVVSIHDERANQCLVQSNPGAAHSVLRPLCLLPGFAAQPHVGWPTDCSVTRCSDTFASSSLQPQLPGEI